jgi:hypothetical protein
MLPMLAGMDPDRAFAFKKTVFREVRPPKDTGMLLVNPLPARSRYASAARFPILFGMGPDRALMYSVRYFSWVNSVIVSGTVPVSIFWVKFSRCSIVKFPIEPGIGPNRPYSSRSNAITWDDPPVALYEHVMPSHLEVQGSS